ncbi:MAG: SDR family oxidoreductase [Pseudomonadota bacterium]
MSSVLITGANRGIGLALASCFVAEGWQVHACCRHPEKATALKALGEAVTIHRLDVMDMLQTENLARNLSDLPLDILVNNAGAKDPGSAFGKVPYEEWSRVFAINTMAPLHLAERFVDHLEGGSRKLIVNISSRMGSIGDNDSGGSYIYRSSKAALNMVTRSLSIDLADRGISAIAVHPGWVRTKMGGPNANMEVDESAESLKTLMLNLRPEDNGRLLNHDGQRIPW